MTAALSIFLLLAACGTSADLDPADCSCWPLCADLPELDGLPLEDAWLDQVDGEDVCWCELDDGTRLAFTVEVVQPVSLVAP